MKLRTKTTLFFGTFFFITTLVVVVFVEYVVGDTLKKQTVHNFRIIAEQSEGTYFAFLGGVKTRVVDWTSDNTVRDLARAIIAAPEGSPLRARLAKEFEIYVNEKKMPYDKTILNTDLLDINGIIVASTNPGRVGKNERSEDFSAGRGHDFDKVVNSKFGEVFFSSIVFEKDESTKPIMSAIVRLSVPVKDGESQPLDALLLVYFANTEQIANALGMGAGTQTINTIDRISSQAFLESYKTSDIYLVNSENFMVTPSRYMQNTELRQKVETFPISECFENGKEVSEEYENYQGVMVLGASMCFRDNGLVLVVEIQRDEVFAPLSALTRILIAGGLTVLVFGSLAAIFFVRRPIAHINNIVDVSKRVAQGDLDARVTNNTKDEIGYLASMFNTMITSIRDVQRELEASKSEIEKRTVLLEEDLEEHKKQQELLEQSKKATLNLLEDSWNVGEKLKKESSRMNAVLSSIGDALILIDGEYKIVLVNPQALKVLTMPQEELIGKDLREVVRIWKKSAEVPFAEWPIEEMFLTKSIVMTTVEEEFSLSTASQEMRLPVSFSIAPLGGGLSGGVIIIHDTTADHDLNEAKSGFISVASHQLRTPLTSIRWYSEMLLSEDVGPLNEAQKDFMSEVHGGAERLYQTVDLLLGISRVESGKIKTEKQQIDLSVFTMEIAKELASQIDEKDSTLSIVPPKGDAIVVSLDPITLRQVVLNMFSNAIRYTKLKNGIIEVAWQKNEKDNEVVYSVRDNGIGIPEAAQERIFSKFFRAENARAAVPDGSGLGLALVKELVESWGGRVWFETEEGKGTSFFFTIPLI